VNIEVGNKEEFRKVFWTYTCISEIGLAVLGPLLCQTNT